MQTQADMGIGPVSCENCSVFKKGEGGPEAPGALRLRNKKATASVASSYSQNPPVGDLFFLREDLREGGTRQQLGFTHGLGAVVGRSSRED